MKLDITNHDLAASKRAYMTQGNFFADIVANLAETLEDTIGLQDAEGFVAVVGTALGNDVSALYDDGKSINTNGIAKILVDLKDRIGGEFKVEAISNDQIVLSNSRCPFAHRAEGKPSLCMMTTNVFGRVAADRNGYAHVIVDDSIALNGKSCHVTVTLTPDLAPDGDGYEFFGR